MTSSWYHRVCVRLYLNKEVHLGHLVLVMLCVCILAPADAYAFNGEKYGTICKRVLETIEGKFGAVLTAAAGIGAIVASAAGGFKMAWSLLVVAIGSFTLRTYQEIWFAPCGG